MLINAQNCFSSRIFCHQCKQKMYEGISIFSQKNRKWHVIIRIPVRISLGIGVGAASGFLDIVAKVSQVGEIGIKATVNIFGSLVSERYSAALGAKQLGLLVNAIVIAAASPIAALITALFAAALLCTIPIDYADERAENHHYWADFLGKYHRNSPYIDLLIVMHLLAMANNDSEFTIEAPKQAG